ncbi:sulfatase-like hydrolase/transferase [Mucilaginibacter sp. S1162]|uniref:Sulfatase-like hydrolase/transferase n=1 Tax=Mucilaginibacter humi TaxID=2732510 RepID=A0ABX1W4Y0_9SPHI|nr:sulfatase-like hydrolase/transferase [Mucilaginibacter humi]NNU33345.1 sulfatase-like hydrolase/transferase [Mucilaginibacter humi]
MKYNKLYLLLPVIGASVALLAWTVKPKPKMPAAPKRPNIVVILADDMGFSDLGCYGGEINTPNINYPAQNGIRFTNFYNASRCCPTRASLLTGLYNHQAGIGKMSDEEDAPGYPGHLTDNAVTLAEVLKTAGYHTAMSGKWHVKHAGAA